ncbi:MAG: nucleoside triphosphate pyrophosphohydrolase [Pseudanabaenaceae cyanobacterium bins.68]|nr:nucleoside triphosphate pyrophosphohydrolase [Pseudanabaenaceae cyanobacterium bins.68]
MAIVARLRSPVGGCAWDLAQTQESLIPYVIEEAYEVVDAIQTGNAQAICEELGDLLLQVVLQAQVASDRGDFDLEQVAAGISAKLIRRHPHVFGNLELTDPEQIAQNWQKIKAVERGEEGMPKLSKQLAKDLRSGPALATATKISIKAAAQGFEWQNLDQVWQKVIEELGELQQAIATESQARQESELGDLLFALIQIARWQGLDPARALYGTSQRFIQRLEKVEELGDRPLNTYTLSELEQLWQQAKQQLGE